MSTEELSLERVEALIDGARKPSATVKICLRLDLQNRFEELEEQLRQAEADRKRRDSLDGGVDTSAVIAEMDALIAEMESATIPFRFEPLPAPKWSAMILAHPPRKDDAGNVVVLDQQGINQTTFMRELIPASCVWPPLSPERWQELLNGKLTDGQIADMGATCWALNRRDGDVPFSRLASAIRRRSEGGSRPQSG